MYGTSGPRILQHNRTAFSFLRSVTPPTSTPLPSPDPGAASGDYRLSLDLPGIAISLDPIPLSTRSRSTPGLDQVLCSLVIPPEQENSSYYLRGPMELSLGPSG